MSTCRFPYRTKSIQLGTVVDPLIQIEINARYGWQPVWMLVDTGADTTILPLSFAQELGIEFNSKKEKLFGIGNDAVYGFATQVKLKIKNVTFPVRIYILDTNQQILLLGRLDIFDKFTLIFENKQKVLILKEI